MTFVFQRFPYDIFREIMLYTYVYTLQRPYNSDEPEFDLQVSLPPILASQVCRAWRRSLLSDPTMWRSLVIHEMSNNWIMELLRRSDTASLNVFLDLDSNRSFGIPASYDERHTMLSSLFQQTHRFKILRLRIDYWNSVTSNPPNMQEALAKQILSYLQKPAPKLEVLSLWVEFHDSWNFEFSKGALFSGDAPNLKRIHHRPSLTFNGFDFPVLNNLSEIYLSPSLDLRFDHFLDLLELSPTLKLLHVCVGWMSEADITWATSTWPHDREVSLPCLESLFLDVERMTALVDLFFQIVDLPPNFEWHINSTHIPIFEESSSLLEFLSRAHLTSLHIEFPKKSILFSEKHSAENYHNRFDTNEFAYVDEEAETLFDLWEPLEHNIELINITHLVLEDVSNSTGIFNIFKSMPNLEYLVIKQSRHPRVSTSSTYGTCLSLLSTLILLTKETLEYIPVPRWDPKLDAPCSENIPTHNSIPLPYCPLLREITLKLWDPLGEISARVLRGCSGLRQKAGCHLKIHVRCPSIDEEAERLLKEDDAIEVFIVPIKIKEGY